MIDLEEYVRVHPSELVTRPPFSDLFPVRRDLREKIAHSMAEKGFDPSKPINVWRQENVVVDGHTRREAAAEAGIEVMVCFHDFKDEDEAMDYAIANQRDRRNLDDADFLRLVRAADKRRKAGRPAKELAQSCANSGKSSVETAQLTGVSPRKVEQTRAVIEDVEECEAVLAGKKSINQAERAVQAKKQKETSEKLQAAIDWIESNGNSPIEDIMSKGGFSRGTVHKARQKLGLAKAAKPKTRKEIERKAYASVKINGNGNGTVIEPAVAREQVERYDATWLESLPIRSKIERTKGFDADALIVRECKPLIQEIKARIERLIGHRSPAGMSSVHRALRRVFDLADPESWHVCEKCKGSGLDDSSPCGACKNGGYIIPYFTKGAS